MSRSSYWSRRQILGAASATASAALAPAVLRAQSAPTRRFLTIPDPDSWHPSLRLKGDWLIFEVTDGILSGFGEASHSRDDEGCKAAATWLFAEHFQRFAPTLESHITRYHQANGRPRQFVKSQ